MLFSRILIAALVLGSTSTSLAAPIPVPKGSLFSTVAKAVTGFVSHKKSGGGGSTPTPHIAMSSSPSHSHASGSGSSPSPQHAAKGPAAPAPAPQAGSLHHSNSVSSQHSNTPSSSHHSTPSHHEEAKLKSEKAANWSKVSEPWTNGAFNMASSAMAAHAQQQAAKTSADGARDAARINAQGAVDAANVRAHQ